MTAGSIVVPTIIPLRPPVPGRPKHIIDTITRIELKSDTMNVNIYYTLDGSKPEPFAALGTDRSTFKYKGPFTLPEGKQTIKAMATSKDGVRQSNINTKVFEVELVEVETPFIQEDDDKAFQKDLAKERRQRSVSRPYRRAWNEDTVDRLEANMTDMSVRGSHRLPAYDAARFTSTRFSQSNGHGDHNEMEESFRGSQRTAPSPHRQTMRLQKQTDFLRCTYCFADRPSDPYARFCQTCGNAVPPLPSHRLPQPDAGEMGKCYYCNSTVPLNTEKCVVCESPIADQNQPHMSLKLSESKVCSYCGTGNPATLNTCLLCEAVLPTKVKPVQTREFAPPMSQQSTTGGERQCSHCSRINDPDARFCDWCGAKPTPQGVPLTCSRCGASNNMYAAFCSSCGVSISAPTRTESSYWVPIPDRHKKVETTQPAAPIILKPKKVETSSVTTQTVGLYYPSEREIFKKRQEEEEKWAMEKQMRDRKPLLTSVSPGRGYWRKQLEHVTLHLKAEAQNNPEFRAMIGEARMGKLTAVSVHEDGFELTLTASYALRGVQDPTRPSAFTGSKVLSDVTHRRRHMDSDMSSEDSDERDSIGQSEITEAPPTDKVKRRGIKKKSNKKEPRLSLEDRKLIKEVGKNGEGRADEVHLLITEGATPLVCTAQGTPALVLATTNKHAECLPVLLEAGADVNSADKNGNTALHEAINVGYEGKDMIDILLSHGASLVVKNNKGQTPHDLAVRVGNEAAVKRLMTSLGQTNLDKISKSGMNSARSSKINLF